MAHANIINSQPKKLIPVQRFANTDRLNNILSLNLRNLQGRTVRKNNYIHLSQTTKDRRQYIHCF